ncbi:TIGR01777 family protein [Candidatus Poribacteria bacterium]|nr:TIGR01777 family protein [Candidatus Poribacteria bacterium]
MERNAAHDSRPRVAVSGSTGFLGGALCPALESAGYVVARVRRAEFSADSGSIQWNPEGGLPRRELAEGLTGFIHLAGENLAAGRWTPARIRRIRDSRVAATENLCRQLRPLEHPPGTFLCASAVGYYGNAGEEVLDESHKPGGGFLAGLCREWEAAATNAFEGTGTRVVLLRFGMILGPGGGALASMRLPFRMGLGGPIGGGRQFVSWIALEDAVRAVLHLLQDVAAPGPFNVVAPNPARQREFAATLGRVLGRPAVLPLPAFAARLVFGRMADEVLLSGQRAKPKRLIASGFRFRHLELDGALRAAMEPEDSHTHRRGKS